MPDVEGIFDDVFEQLERDFGMDVPRHRFFDDAFFKDLNEQQRITVILVTHDADIARNARRTIALRDGYIVADTTDCAAALAALHSTDEPVGQVFNLP